MKNLILFIALACTGMSAAFAQDAYISFTFTGAFVFGTGYLDGIDNGDGSFTAIDGTASETVDGLTETLTLVHNPNGTSQSVSPAGAFTFDDQIFYHSNPQLSGDGLLFMSPSQEINIGSIGTGSSASYMYYEQNLYSSAVTFDVDIAEAGSGGGVGVPIPSVPEPAGMMMMFTGLGMLWLAARRRTH